MTMEQTLEAVQELVASPGVSQHVVINAAKVAEAERNSALRDAILSCDLINADGMSVVWASRLLGTPLPERVTGIDLMTALFERAETQGWPVYLLGAEDAVIHEVVDRLRVRYPELPIAGFRNGYWSPDQEPEVVSAVALADAKLLFVAMPSPRKELFVARHRQDLNVGLVVGVGGSFDVLAGVTKRAPDVLQRAGLEWLFRLVQEPRRMWKRYLVGNTKFIGIVARQRLSSRR
ncbi:UDP-N-acetyl-D-mannosamine transferase [Knoellia sinensis KCTC 19936]|uniref:UDP-N-acetyl-D-mannosamine transferase n=1 Tax=Knoellia sinensis KCTC 19936 TaxID=1385520 RepID=A0A0A0JEW3_9MICO|nr:UDP-N-acetyl-D-mannosamine transferase [Knoellia sinensis KCTC 19936]